MKLFNDAKHLLALYREDKRGNFAMTAGLFVTVLILGLGVGYDYSQLTHAEGKSQTIADQAALQAAVFVKNNGHMPSQNDHGLVHGQTYSAKDLGYNFNGLVKNGAQGVTVKVEYDDINKEATAYVTGRTEPAFMQVWGYGDLDFTARSVVNYEQLAPQQAASIVLVMDNSGSMSFDDKQAIVDYNGGWLDKWDDFDPNPDAIRRIDGLKTSAKDFMTHLDTVIGPQNTPGSRVLRTGLLAYNGNLIAARTVEPKWGTIPDGSINSMTPNGSTNSSPPMALANTWLQGEPAVHLTETGEDEPLKFLIFMTDGQNTSGNTTWEPADDTGFWRKWYYGQWNHGYANWDASVYGWEQGHYVLQSDNETLASCEAMKAQGVIIYTIAFALEPGWYYTNEWGNGYNNHNDDYFRTTSSTHQAASALMEGCASKEAMFLEADDSEALEGAFRQIANHIVTELIRIKS